MTGGSQPSAPSPVIATEFATTFKLGGMPYDMVERSKSTFGEKVVPWIRGDLDRHAATYRAEVALALHSA